MCLHQVLYVESFDEFGPRTSCLFCNEDVHVDQSKMEREWMLFDSQEAPSWSASRLHLERDTLLVKRHLFND
jgi:hypothetical protein